MSLLHALGNAALDLLAPPTCPGCDAGLFSGERASPFCGECELAIAPRDPAGCVACDRELGDATAGLCRACRRRLAPLSGVQATFEYEGPIAAAIQGLKYNGRDDLLAPLTRRWLAEWDTRRTELDRPLVVPVPLHPRRLAKRGFDQAWLLAREVARATRCEARARALRRRRATPPQVGLGRAARELNVHGAFAADGSLAGRDILLIDDVLTTGATLHACAQALIEAGARSVRAAVVARAQP